MMACGHPANGTYTTGWLEVDCCTLCVSAPAPEQRERARTPRPAPRLEGRVAECHCGRTAASSKDLAYFEYLGSPQPAHDVCARCGHGIGAHMRDGAGLHHHDGAPVGVDGCEARGGYAALGAVHDRPCECREFVPGAMLPARETDRFYCGCRGWD